jgi:dynein intermediate chain
VSEFFLFFKSSTLQVDAHFGFITSIEPHPSRSSKYKHLLLSSSLDWTVKLWDLKNFAQPLIEFFTPSYDYVCDVQWSPVHPAVFVTVTSGGRISLWNLAKSSTEPVDALNIATDMEELSAAVSGVSVGGARGAEASAAAGAGARALNKVVWARDGLSVLCGDSQGTLHMLKLYPAAVLPSPQDEGRFELAIVSRAMEHSAHVAEESKMTSLETTPKKRSDGESEGGMKASDSDLSFALE